MGNKKQLENNIYYLNYYEYLCSDENNNANNKKSEYNTFY